MKMEKKGVPHQLQAQQALNYLFSLSTVKTMISEGPKRNAAHLLQALHREGFGACGMGLRRRIVQDR